MNKKSPSGFTLIELLVVIAIIAVLASFAVPAITSALTKGQLVGTVNNARQYYLASYQMALDGNTNADINYNWPGDYNPAITSLEVFSTRLVANQYLKTGDLAKLLSGPGAIVGATGGVTDPVTGVTSNVVLTGTPGLKVYLLHDGDSANTIFAVSNNYIYNTALTPATSPFGDKGFVVIRKGGDCLSLRKNNALATNYPNVAAFQSAVGKLVGDPDGGPLGTESGTTNLVFP